jgi:hypothetical protein
MTIGPIGSGCRGAFPGGGRATEEKSVLSLWPLLTDNGLKRNHGRKDLL